MSGIQESEAKQRAARREAERQRQREERQAQASSRRAARQGTTEEEDDPNDPLAAERRIWREKQRAKAAASGGSSTAAVGSEMSQEDAMIAHANKLQEENRQTLKNTIRVARETTEVGAATISKLDQQTEQFNRMDNTLDETNDSLTRSERILKGMKSIGGAISNMFSSKPKPKAGTKNSGLRTSGGIATNATDELEEKDRARQLQRETAGRSGASSSSTSMPDGGIDELVAGRSSTVPPNAKQSAAIAQMTANQSAEDDALDELGDVLGTLKEQSQMMNRQLAQQSQILDNLGDKVDKTSERLKKGSRTMQKIS